VDRLLAKKSETATNKILSECRASTITKEEDDLLRVLSKGLEGWSDTGMQKFKSSIREILVCW
jgi:hypothetical protein